MNKKTISVFAISIVMVLSLSSWGISSKETTTNILSDATLTTTSVVNTTTTTTPSDTPPTTSSDTNTKGYRGAVNSWQWMEWLFWTQCKLKADV